MAAPPSTGLGAWGPDLQAPAAGWWRWTLRVGPLGWGPFPADRMRPYHEEAPARWLEARRSWVCARVERQVGVTRKWPDGGVGQRPANHHHPWRPPPGLRPPAPGSGPSELPGARRMPVPDTFQNRKSTRCLGTNRSRSHLSRYSGGNGLRERRAPCRHLCRVSGNGAPPS